MDCYAEQWQCKQRRQHGLIKCIKSRCQANAATWLRGLVRARHTLFVISWTMLLINFICLPNPFPNSRTHKHKILNFHYHIGIFLPSRIHKVARAIGRRRLSLACVWDVFGLGYVWDVFATCAGWVWDMFGMWWGLVRGNLGSFRLSFVTELCLKSAPMIAPPIVVMLMLVSMWSVVGLGSVWVRGQSGLGSVWVSVWGGIGLGPGCPDAYEYSWCIMNVQEPSISMLYVWSAGGPFTTTLAGRCGSTPPTGTPKTDFSDASALAKARAIASLQRLFFEEPTPPHPAMCAKLFAPHLAESGHGK